MRINILISILLLLAISTIASNIQVGGDVSGTWDADTIQVIDDLLVPTNQILVINPGVKVIFYGHYTFSVAGQIFANGLANDSISFFVSDTLGLYNLEDNKGSWGGFWFEPGNIINDSSTFEFCNFKYGKAVAEDSTYWYGGAVYAKKFNKLRFSNCLFSNNISYKNGGAIYCLNSDIKIDHCDFINNAAGTELIYGYGGGVCLEYSNTEVYRNYFTNNSSTGVGGGLSFEYSNPDIEANVFYDNYSAIGGGLCCLRSDKGNSIVNNLFDNNSSTFFGGGVAFLEAHALFTNNTVVNNLSMYAGGLFFNVGAKSIIKNNIIWNNTIYSLEGPQVYVYDVYSAPEFYYNNIEGGFEEFSGEGVGNFIGVYDNNININPQFVGLSEFPYSLSEGSPCINSGTPDTLGLLLPILDLAENIRLKEDSLDMGCYENQGGTGFLDLSIVGVEFTVFPNPITENSMIELNVQERTALKFTIMDSYGKIIYGIPMQYYSNGKHHIKLPPLKLNSGLYFLKATEEVGSKKSKTLKLIIY